MQRNCDVVMKGGITSGVVYPKAIVRLSKHFRLRNIGGTSAGAIAAAAAGAAQHGQATGKGTGFDGLEQLPGYLEDHLEELFQPEDSTEPLFEVLLAATKAEGGSAKLGAVSGTALAVFRLPGFAGSLLGLGLGAVLILGHATGWALVAGLVAAALVALIGLVAGVAIAMGRRALAALPDNYFGLCTGYQPDERVEPRPLTSWLAAKIDELAGTADGPRPLTFADLWGTTDPDQEKDVDLRMVTTSLTQGAAYELPMTDHQRWFFKEREFRDLFPKRVVDWMVSTATPGERGKPVEGLHPLPAPADMPVVVAARMSLSFPGLISAVPLWTVDLSRRDRIDEAYAAHEAWERGEEAKFAEQNPWRPERCWFSDGGITSNFPIQFFDSPVPRWPTFGINLLEFGRGWDRDPLDQSKNIQMAFDNEDGQAEPWTDLDIRGNFKRLAAFAGAIMGTSRSWMDNAQMRIPGYRDRIVHIGHDKVEGGMNLSMKADVIAHLSERGEKAADELIRRFDVKPTTPYPLTWENQRWVRYRSYLTELETNMPLFQRGCEHPLGSDSTIRKLSDRGVGQRPTDYNWSYDQAGQSPQREFADDVTDRINELARFWERSPEKVEPGTPEPRPQLRLTPRL